MTTDDGHLRAVHDLVADARAGDQDAMDELITRLRPMIFRYCRSRLIGYAGGLEAADDAAQETCMAIYKVVPTYQDDGAPFTAWVFSVAANKVADAQRAFARAAVPVDDLPDQTEPSPTPEERAVAAAHLAAAVQLVDQLPPRMRSVLLLRASGVPAEQVAVELGMSAGAVRVTHHRAVAKLRQLVSESAEHLELFPTSVQVPIAS